MQLPTLIPENAITRSELRVRFCETDLMGIVHHAQYLTYFEAGRVEWLRRRGITYASWTAQDIHLPVVDATLKYRAPARFDDVLIVETRLSDLRWASVRYAYAIKRGAELLVEGETRLACVTSAHVLQRIPAEVLAILVGGETA
jgi:acyl-CoA thioester hydrolase